MDRSLTLFELEIPHDKLTIASKQETAFFLKSMVILHDIYALQRAILFSEKPLRGEKMNSPVVSAQVAQSFAFIKGLAGILCEAYEFIQFGFFVDNRVPLNCRNYKKYKVRKKIIQKFKMVDLASKFLPSMSADDLRAVNEVEDYFSKPNLMRRLRNKFAFHYDFHEALEHLNKFLGIEDPHLFWKRAAQIVAMLVPANG